MSNRFHIFLVVSCFIPTINGKAAVGLSPGAQKTPIDQLLEFSIWNPPKIELQQAPKLIELQQKPLNPEKPVLFPTLPPPPPSDCLSACSEFVMPVINAVVLAGSNTDRLKDACGQFEIAESCMKEMTHCPRNDFYYTTTSGVRYMCIEQRRAFDANSNCMDKVNDQVYQECDQECNTQALLAGLTAKETLSGLGEGFEGFMKNFIDPQMINIVVSETCRIGQCLLGCYKNKFDAHCDGAAGSLLSEALIRPLDNTQPLGAIFGTFLPSQCRFVYENDQRNNLRITRKLDEDLKKMYTDPKITPGLTTEERVLQPFLDATNKQATPVETFVAETNASTSSTSTNQTIPFPKGIGKTITSVKGVGKTNAQLNMINRMIGINGLSAAAFNNEIPKVPGSVKSGQAPVKRNVKSDGLSEFFEDDPFLDEEHDGLLAPEESKTQREPTKTDEGNPRSQRESGEQNEYDEFVTNPFAVWQVVEERPVPTQIGEPIIEIGAQPGLDGITHLHLERTTDNADLYMAQWIHPGRRYRVDVNVEPDDEGELICLLRTYKGFAVNRLSDADIDQLLAEIETTTKQRKTREKPKE
ncbi:unnamed protein product, partial [Mesorhabditis belari]|uniref:Chondroitin proteoglycan 4 domain-containing protein n=1 Tax=Mesorhabditis belari TaxID=2138241 RepID=A0AAF3FDH6_9BILA